MPPTIVCAQPGIGLVLSIVSIGLILSLVCIGLVLTDAELRR
jgi:hypothetical protein